MPSHASAFQGRLSAALVVITLVWGYSWIVMKQAMAHAGPFVFAAVSALLAVPVLFGMLRWRREPLGLRTGRLACLVVLIGLTQLTGFQALVQWALVEGGAGKTALFAYTMPFWATLLAWGLLGERPHARFWAGLAVAAAGLLLVLEPWSGLPNAQSAGLAVTAGACQALGVVLARQVLQKETVSPLALNAWQTLIGGLGLLLIALCANDRHFDGAPALWGAILYNAFLVTALAASLWLFVVARIPAGTAGVCGLLIPVFGMLVAWWQLGETPTWSSGAGFAALVLAVLVIVLPFGSGEAVETEESTEASSCS